MFELRQLTIGRLLDEITARHPDRPAVEYLGRTVSYTELDLVTDTLARGLLALGVEKGSHVGIWGNDRPNTLYILLAIVKIGAVAVMLGTGLQKTEAEALITQANVRYLFFDEGFRGVSFADIIPEMSIEGLKKAVYMGPDVLPGFLSLDGLYITAKAVSDETLSRVKQSVTPDDWDTILFTSGTTGAAKGVVTTHFSRVNTAFAHVEALRACPHDRFCIVTPMFHCFSLTAGVLSALIVGACIYFPANRRTGTILEAVSVDRCTVLSAVPTLYSALIARDDIGSYDLSPLRTGFIGGSSYTAEFFKKVENVMQFNLLPALGQTEATAGFTFADYDAPLEVRANTIGAFMDHIEGEIRDINNNEPVPAGMVGEICIRGFNVMQGYYAQPELTETVLEPDGWLHTGDLGFLDENGNIHMAGRLKELIIRGGENISPGEIEDTVMSDPRVRSVKAIGVPDAHYGEEICMCLVLQEGVSMTDGEVRDLVGSRHAYFKIPKYVLFFDELPVTSSGKIAFGKLRETAGQMLGKNMDLQ
ncbi:MAG: AMP-binding protein [Clostridiales bacterium]|jgi:fatty-acyl-CoA synthase|nr:AMP-binding protein [Clostridiales bacterium]